MLQNKYQIVFVFELIAASSNSWSDVEASMRFSLIWYNINWDGYLFGSISSSLLNMKLSLGEKQISVAWCFQTSFCLKSVKILFMPPHQPHKQNGREVLSIVACIFLMQSTTSLRRFFLSYIKKDMQQQIITHFPERITLNVCCVMPR